MASLDIYERVVEDSDYFHSFAAFSAGKRVNLVDFLYPQIEQPSAQCLETFLWRLWLVIKFKAFDDW